MDRKELFIEYYLNSENIKDIDPNIWMANYVVDRMELNEEQIIWFCFLNSITYQFPTSYLLINEYPDLENVDIDRLSKWWKDAQSRCPFQTDKIKQRKYLPDSVESYQALVNGSQKGYFDNILNKSPQENFRLLWEEVYIPIKHFGRFSVWNFAQMLKQVAGYDIEPDTLFLGESNAESHTHGLCYAFGKDEWAKKVRYKDENGKRKKKVHKFSKEDKEFLELEASELMETLKERGSTVDAFNIETVACAFKKIFRENDSRYVGYYLDRQAEDIIKLEKENWNGVDWSLLWDARWELLNHNLLNEHIRKDRFKERPDQKKLANMNTMDEWF
jgi:hypothetical protein